MKLTMMEILSEQFKGQFIQGISLKKQIEN